MQTKQREGGEGVFREEPHHLSFMRRIFPLAESYAAAAATAVNLGDATSYFAGGKSGLAYSEMQSSYAEN